jgi:hypothetical protein
VFRSQPFAHFLGFAFRACILCFFVVSSNLSAQVPAPADVFGFRPGADYKLANYEQIQRYFEALDAASDRVVLERIGESTLGRTLLVALISSEENLSNRERYRTISQRLALTKGVAEGEARRMAKEGRAIVWIDGGLHATEVAHGQMTPELAYWLATDEGDEARRVRENVILLLMANMNPDGLDIVADWYGRNLGTPYETSSVPELYHHYIGHDNNRDWFMFTQAETKAVANQLYHVWFPQIVYNHHQSGPFPGRIWVPPFENPVNPNLDPLVVTSINQIGEAMKKRFDEEEKPGVSSGIVYDMWWNGSMRGAPDFHNMLGFLTETALYRYATPHCYGPEEIPEDFGARAGNLPAKRPTTNYSNPWLGGCWHLRDPIEYMLTGSRAVLDLASKLKEDYLYNIYRMGKRQIVRGERGEGGPFAYVIDLEAQHDPGTAVELLQIFRQGGVEIRRAARPFQAGGRSYAAGTYVIPPQAFRPFVVDLMEPKRYPDRRQYPGGPPEPPYDMTGYELSFQLGVDADRIMEPFSLPDGVAETISPAAGGVTGDGNWGYLVTHAANASAVATNRLLANGAEISWAAESFEAAGVSWPAGTIVVRRVERSRVVALGRELGLEFHAVSGAPATALDRVRAPRIGLYKSYVASMPEGWTRWLFENYGFQFDNVENDDIRNGDLTQYDAIVLPDQSADAILNGHLAGRMPAEFTGGLGVEGAAALKRFVEEGGWLLAIDQATDFAISQFGLPVRNTVASTRPSEFFIPGSVIRVQVDPSDPLGYGMPEEAYALFVRSQVFSVVPPASEGGRSGERNVDVFARYPRENYLVSGWAHGGDRYLAGQVAGLRLPMGQGQVVLLGFEPHFRGQPRNTYKLLFNPLFASTLDKAVWSRADAGVTQSN